MPIGLLAAAVLASLVVPVPVAALQAPPDAPTTHLEVRVPSEDATLIVDGRPVGATGHVRQVDAPAPGDGTSARYVFDVSWKPNAYTVLRREVAVNARAGEHVRVDLTRETSADRAEVIYVPTPHDVASAMVELAGIRSDDVVYELGCGDGRVIIAVKYGGARRGVGIDISPNLVERSRNNVNAAGIADRVEIREGDVFDDRVTEGLEKATVVMLYMSDELDRLLLPTLRRALAPGARIVSHRVMLGDWKPDRTITVYDSEDQYVLHLWTVQARSTPDSVLPGR